MSAASYTRRLIIGQGPFTSKGKLYYFLTPGNLVMIIEKCTVISVLKFIPVDRAMLVSSG